jgi:hypothetical protein
MRRYLPILVIVIIALSARLIPGPRIIDDSYITFRYSRNILAGNGFTFNPEERVLGTTTPLYTLILTGVGSIFGGSNTPFPEISWILNAILDAIACVVLLQVGKKMASDRVGLIAALSWAVAPFSVTFSIGGLETSLFVLLLFLTSYFYLYSKPYGLWLCAFFMILTRPDALVFILPMIAFPVIHRGLRCIYKFKPIILASIPLVAWIVFSSIYFGSPLPHSVTAKSVAYLLPENAAFIRFLQHYLTPFNEQYTFGQNFLYAGLVFYPLLYVFGSLAIFRKDSSSLPILAYPLLYFLTFSLAHPLIFRWYLTPPLPFYILILLTGAEALLTKIATMLKGKWAQSTWVKILVTSILCLPIVISLNSWVIKPNHGNSTPSPEMAWIKLEEIYQMAAKDALEITFQHSVIAAGDVGVLGYDTNRKILDTVGLNSPVSTKYYPLSAEEYVINYAIPTQLILDEQPDLVIFLEVYGRNTLLRSTAFLSSYRLVNEYPTDLYSSRNMLMYQRIN